MKWWSLADLPVFLFHCHPTKSRSYSSKYMYTYQASSSVYHVLTMYHHQYIMYLPCIIISVSCIYSLDGSLCNSWGGIMQATKFVFMMPPHFIVTIFVIIGEYNFLSLESFKETQNLLHIFLHPDHMVS